MVLLQLTVERQRIFFRYKTGAIEVFFPTSPSRGDTIVLSDYGNFATNKCIINTGRN